MEYSSTVSFESQVCPGVAYKLHKPSYGRVLEFDRNNAEFRQKAREINKRNRDLQDEIEAQRKQWTSTQEEKLRAAKANHDAEAIARIEAGFEFERLVDLARRGATPEQYAEILEKLAALSSDAEKFQADPELLKMLADVRYEANQLTAHLYNGPRLKWGLASIDGIAINGKPATADSLLLDGPPDLAREIIARIDEIASMTPEQLKNFASPSTSSAAEPKALSNTTAEAA